MADGIIEDGEVETIIEAVDVGMAVEGDVEATEVEMVAAAGMATATTTPLGPTPSNSNMQAAQVPSSHPLLRPLTPGQ
jgi:hypothetical protein